MYKILTLLIYFVRLSVLGNHFCGMSCGDLPHACCSYQKFGFGEMCNPPVQRYDMNDSERELLVEMHNIVRNKIASGKEKHLPMGSSNMQILTYDKELEFISECWASQCLLDTHQCMNSVRGRTSHIVWQGDERISKKETGKRYLAHSIFQFFLHTNLLNTSIFTKFTKSSMPNELLTVTQVLWANTKYVGCSRVSFNSQKRKMKTYNVVCTYYPAGNIENEPVYLDGEPCSSCNNQTVCNKHFTSLCGQIEWQVQADTFKAPFNVNIATLVTCGKIIHYALIYFLFCIM
nr:venom allergen 5-like [Onthophagus taurus]